MPTSVVVRPNGCECHNPERLVHDVTCHGGRSAGRSFAQYTVRVGPHRLGLILGPIDGLDGWTAHPASRSYKPGLTPDQMADPSVWDKHVGPPSIEGFKTRRFAIDYLLRAEGYRRWEF